MKSGYILGLMSFLFLFFGYIGVPVPFALMAGVLIGASFTEVSHVAIIQKMFDGMDSEALLAIPFFLLVGELMSSANVVVRVVNLSLALVGHIRGGLSQVVTVFSMFFSEMSGSTTADVAVISRALGRPMKTEGYSPAFIAAIIASASTIAALVPPSITAVVYGAMRAFYRGFCAWHDDWRGPDDLLLFLRPHRHATSTSSISRTGGSFQRRCASSDDSRHSFGLYPHRLVHSDGGGCCRCRLYPAW